MGTEYLLGYKNSVAVAAKLRPARLKQARVTQYTRRLLAPEGNPSGASTISLPCRRCNDFPVIPDSNHDFVASSCLHE